MASSLTARVIRSAAALALAAGVFAPSSALADSDAGTETTQVDASPLPPLPKVPSTELPTPDPRDVEDLDALLGRVRSADATVREEAAREVLEAPTHWVSAIDHRMDQLADAADRGAMRLLLEDVRTKGRDAERSRMRASGAAGQVDTPDYLSLLVSYGEPKKKAWQDLIAVVAMSRMLVSFKNVAAARELIDVYVRFGEFLRVDTQKNLAELGDVGVAALIEATHHKAEKIAHWAARQLDALGKGIPGEAVQTEDYAALADILRAYGRVRDPDAARIVISFANSERALVREGARQSVALMGQIAIWQLRDIYENTLGKRAPREWTWDRTARELFAEYDRLRLSKVYKEFDEGVVARTKGDLDAMRTHFDLVLVASPRFDRKAEMAAGYFEYAEKHAEDSPDAARLALSRIERIADDETLKKRAQSLDLTLDARARAGKGVAEAYLVRRALELDPNNRRAAELKRKLEVGRSAADAATGRYAAAAAIGGVALLAIAFIAFWRGQAPWKRRDRAKPAPPGAPADAAPQQEDAPVPENATGAASEAPNTDGATAEPGLTTESGSPDSSTPIEPDADRAGDSESAPEKNDEPSGS